MISRSKSSLVRDSTAGAADGATNTSDPPEGTKTPLMSPSIFLSDSTFIKIEPRSKASKTCWSEERNWAADKAQGWLDNCPPGNAPRFIWVSTLAYWMCAPVWTPSNPEKLIVTKPTSLSPRSSMAATPDPVDFVPDTGFSLATNRRRLALVFSASQILIAALLAVFASVQVRVSGTSCSVSNLGETVISTEFIPPGMQINPLGKTSPLESFKT